jgi:hypothetical protein
VKHSTIIEIICYAFFLLFLYTSASKLLAFNIYLEDLNRSPELAPFSGLLSILIPGLELIIAGLLLFKNTRLIGFAGATALMMLFTGYVAYVLVILPEGHRPCTCGGIIRALSWRDHFVFNIIFTVLGLVGYILTKRLQPHEITTL